MQCLSCCARHAVPAMLCPPCFACHAVPVMLRLSRCACHAAPLRCACHAVPVMLCLSCCACHAVCQASYLSASPVMISTCQACCLSCTCDQRYPAPFFNIAFSSASPDPVLSSTLVTALYGSSRIGLLALTLLYLLHL